MSSKRSILNRVLYLNLTMAVVLTLVFLCTSGLYTRQLTRERYNLASTTLTKVNTDFQLEMNRLDSLLTLCLQDSSLVFSISDRLATSFFLDNAEDAASRLSLIRQSLPYAKLVYLYTHNSDKVVRDNGSLYKGKDFSRIVLDKTVEDISQLPDGLSFFQDSTALYVKNLYSHGYVAVELDLSKFANINKTIGDQFLGYVIQQKDGRCILENSSVPLSEEQLSAALDGGLIGVNGTKYYCVSAPMNILPYTGLVLINNDALMLPLHYMYLVMVIAFGVLLASSLLLVVLNYKIYLPLRKFTSQFSDSRENEISIIENEIHDLLSEINTLSQHSKEQIPEKIALHYLLCGGSQLDEGSLKLLEEKYPYYMIMALAIQKDSGIEDLLFTSSLEKTLTSQFALKFISLDKFSFAVLARPEDKEEILAGLQEAAEEASKTTRLFAGIREYCTDIRELQTEYRLAENCLLSAQVLPMENFAFQENAAVLPRKRLGQEVQNRLFEYARNGALDQLLPELKEIFYPAGGCSLSDCRFHYQEVWAVFEKACLARKKAIPHMAEEIPLYNPEYLCQQLTRIATESFPSRREQPQNMQQCMEKYIADHLSEPLTLDTVAEAFSITPVYLSSWFKKNLGVNFLNYISAARMERAGELLCQPNPPKIYEVALAVGIDNTATFIRQFKKHTGLTPSQYQKERLLQKQQGALLGGKTLS